VIGRPGPEKPPARVVRVQPGRLIYAETIEIDSALIGQPPQPATGVGSVDN
jgi:hypothetical protein